MNNKTEFLDEVFTIFGFDESQKKKATEDLNKAIGIKYISSLVNALPEVVKNQLTNNKDLFSRESLEKHFSSDIVATLEKQAVGEIIMAYLSHMTNSIQDDKKQKLAIIFQKYSIIE